MLAKAEKFKPVVELMHSTASPDMKENVPSWSEEKWNFLSFLNKSLTSTIDVILVLIMSVIDIFKKHHTKIVEA
jgi:hypothetical protein